MKVKSPKCVSEIIHTEDTKKAFSMFKKSINTYMARSQPDFKKGFVLTTNASQKGTPAILGQKDDSNTELIISCFSNSQSKAEENYSPTDLELLAVVKCLNISDITCWGNLSR